MLHIVLVEPEIPANTGNIGRTCVITGARLHLVKPLGFSIDDKSVKRAGMDYWSSIDLQVYDSLEQFMEIHKDKRLVLGTTKTDRIYSDFSFQDEDFLVFGPESRGLPAHLLGAYPESTIRIPMRSHPLARSLNLSNAAAIVTYEAYRQIGFKGIL